MARGLSPLQQQILRLAWKRDETRHGPYRLLCPQEIFVRLYGWPITHGSPADHYREHGLSIYPAWHFVPSVIGPKRYHATMVAVHRALARLEARALLERCREGEWAIGWGLTDKGRRIAEQLMVDKAEKEGENVVKISQ